MKEAKSEGNILVYVHVLKDQPGEKFGEFELRRGEPKDVGVYEFYLEKPGILGTGTFKKLIRYSWSK